MDKCLTFKINSSFGYFKRINSTSSPTTYGVIPKTTLIGMISAILGTFEDSDERDVYLNYFNNENCKIAIEVLNPIRKTFFGINYHNLKIMKEFNSTNVKKVAEQLQDKEFEFLEDYYWHSSSYDRGNKYTQVNVEVVRNPYYKVYFYHENDELYQRIKERLFNGECYYHPFMGTTDFPCVITDVSEENLNTINNSLGVVPIDSVIPEHHADIRMEYSIADNSINRDKTILKERQPYLFIKDGFRRNVDFVNIFYNTDGEPVMCSCDNYVQCSGKNIIFY